MFEDGEATEEDDRLSGKASYILFSGNGENLEIPITRYTLIGTETMRTSTSSTNYSEASGTFFPSQISIMTTTRAEVEGRFRLRSTPLEIIGRLYADEEAVAVNFGLDAGNRVGHGRFDITDFRCDVPIDGIVTFACVMTSNGPFYPGD